MLCSQKYTALMHSKEGSALRIFSLVSWKLQNPWAPSMNRVSNPAASSAAAAYPPMRQDHKGVLAMSLNLFIEGIRGCSNTTTFIILQPPGDVGPVSDGKKHRRCGTGLQIHGADGCPGWDYGIRDRVSPFPGPRGRHGSIYR